MSSVSIPVKHLSATRVSAALLGAGLLLVLAGCAPEDAKRDEATGEITEAADAGVLSIAVGDCLGSSDQLAGEEETEIQSLPTVPCSDPHDSEVYAEMTFQEEEFPGDAVVSELDEYCYNAFSPFVGLAYEDSVLEYSLLYPTEVSWEQGDRIGQCVLIHPTELVTGTLEGAAI